MDQGPSDDDAAIEQFHADATRRRRWIMAITSAVCIAIGVIVLVITFSADDGSDAGGGRIEVRTLAAGATFVLAGIGAAFMAIRGD